MRPLPKTRGALLPVTRRAPAAAKQRPRAIIYCGRSDHQSSWGGAFAQGLRRHGVPVEVAGVPDRTRLPSVEFVVFWGHRQQALIDHQRRTGRHYLVLERGYFGDRFQLTSCGWDGLNGHADFCNAGRPADRWRKHGAPMADWQTSGSYALICGQVSGDAAVAGVNLAHWYERAAALIQKSWPGLPVKFRPHPLSRQNVAPAGLKITSRTLKEDLRDAVFTVAYNSNSGVDSLLAGVPTYCGSPGSMAAPLAPMLVNPGALEELPRWVRFEDRAQWAHDLAYCQWTHEEIATGDAWDHLKQKLEAA